MIKSWKKILVERILEEIPGEILWEISGRISEEIPGKNLWKNPAGIPARKIPEKKKRGLWESPKGIPKQILEKEEKRTPWRKAEGVSEKITGEISTRFFGENLKRIPDDWGGEEPR